MEGQTAAPDVFRAIAFLLLRLKIPARNLFRIVDAVLAGGDALAAAGPAVRCRRCRWRAIRKLYSYSTIERTGFLTRAIVRKRFLYKEEKGNFLWKIMANKEFVNRIF